MVISFMGLQWTFEILWELMMNGRIHPQKWSCSWGFTLWLFNGFAGNCRFSSMIYDDLPFKKCVMFYSYVQLPQGNHQIYPRIMGIETTYH